MYLQSGKIEDRAVVNELSEFPIKKFKAIFKTKDISDDQKNSMFKMHSGPRDLIYFTLFLIRALRLENTEQLSKTTNFYSVDNRPIRGALHLATELEHDYIVEQLIRSAIDVNLVDQSQQTAFDIAVDKNLTKIKPILLKRNDLIPNQHDVKLSEHPLRICILDKDQASARIILENYHFKKWTESQLISNRLNLENEFSKLLFDVCMVFRDDYKSSIFILHDLIQN